MIAASRHSVRKRHGARLWNRARGLVAVASAVGCAALGSCSSGTDGDTANVILVMADTLRADYLGCYGFDGDTSPELDALAGESLRFTACFSQAPWTKPSIASLFTSLHPETHGVLTHDGMFAGPESGGLRATDRLPDDAWTLAESLADAGYETHAWVTNPWIRAEHGFDQGFASFGQWMPAERGTAQVFGDAAAWLRERAGERPFFLYLHVMEVHGPYESPESDFEAVRGAAGLGSDRPLSSREEKRLPDYLRLPAWTKEPDAARLATWRARYAAGVRAFDRELGSFVDGLRNDGWLERTALIVTSDHGEELLEHGGWDHGAKLLDHQLHVPLLVRLPTGQKSELREPVELVDLAPTILSIMGLDAPEVFQGRDLLGWDLGGIGEAAPGFSVSTGAKWKPDLVSLRSATHRLILNRGDGTRVLYDVDRDPGETANVAAVEPDVALALEQRLRARLAELAETPALGRETAEVPGAMQSELDALGYTGEGDGDAE